MEKCPAFAQLSGMREQILLLMFTVTKIDCMTYSRAQVKCWLKHNFSFLAENAYL